MKKMSPFSNLSEFMSWQTNNCDQCCRYSNASTKKNNAKCKLAFDLDFACVNDGSISIKTAEKIGLCCGELSIRCNEFNKPIVRKKYKRKELNQTNLFEQ